MDATRRTLLWLQFGAAIDMLSNALQACPDQLWHEPLWERPDDQPDYARFWYLAYHSLFWLDFYLSSSPEGFAPPAPFTLSELDPNGFPERPYAKQELLAYLDYGRQKCRTTIEALSDEQADQPYKMSWGEFSFLELLLYNLRHVQEHAAQLSLFLGQRAGFAPGWVSRARGEG